MKVSKDLVQHIAVFGESGSGKTVLLSSFYGAAQEPSFLKKSLYHVVADDFGQGTQLHKNYLGMKESAQPPSQNRFAATTYSFSISLKTPGAKAEKNTPVDGLRLVWHDYPGEWFEHDVSGPEEAQRRVDEFRSLLQSEVALLLVDGQRLLDYAGEEEKYLKSLLSNIGNALLALKKDLLPDGKPLVEFPRIWLLALTKADLLPNRDVFWFRDLIIAKAADELHELRNVLGELVEASSAMSVGEDFLLLSSAKFSEHQIEVTKRVGVDLLLPVAAMLPFERLVRWAKGKNVPPKIVDALQDGAQVLAPLILDAMAMWKGPVGVALKFLRSKVLSQEVLDAAVTLVGDELKQANTNALEKQNILAATLTGFKMDLERGEAEDVLLRSIG